MSRTASPIVIEDYDPEWPVSFNELATRLLTGLGRIALRVEHIGSTAVTGLAAKPIIDLDVVVARQVDLSTLIRRLGVLGYVHQGDLGIPGREAFHIEPNEPRHHLYALVEGTAELARHLMFRDALRANIALGDRYVAIKRSLAAVHGSNRAAYAQAKQTFIEGVLERTSAVSGRLA